MNWEETIKFIRTQPEYTDLIEKAYFDKDLKLNIERFRNSQEYKETLLLIRQFAPQAKSILDIGSGNGISAISFALDGYKITVSEPDPSDTIGAGAIRKLIREYDIKDMEVHEEFAENINFSGKLFDLIYVRQAMHHAYDLNLFVKNLATLLKPGGCLLTIRDHVIFDEKDKEKFLEAHPLHKFYGGENAFTATQYRDALTGAGLHILKELRYYDSVINYFPVTKEGLINEKKKLLSALKSALKSKIGLLADIPFVFNIYQRKNRANWEKNESSIPGRMYSYIAKKNNY